MWFVQVGWYDRVVIVFILVVVRFVQFDFGDFGNGVRFVGWFQCVL